MIENKVKTPDDLALIKRKTAKRHKIPFPKNMALYKVYHDLLKEKKTPHKPKTPKWLKKDKNLENLLRIRKIRSLSGVSVVSVLTKPFPCPGKCLYCPNQKGMPKSYLDNEPAAMRAAMNNFNPYNQVQSRLRSLEAIGHPIDKIELIVIGGTWSYYPRQYQIWFITRCFQACNEFSLSKNSKSEILKPKQIPNSKIQILKRTLEKEQKINEKSKRKIVAITIETRPDFINEKEIKRLRNLGVTKIEMGVQNIHDDVLELNKRGHKIKETIKATGLLKDAGFKICYHMMPNLPGSDLKKDKEMFEELFKNPDFQPDFLKIYPCMVIKEAPLYKLWKQKKYKTYTDKQLINLFKEIKKKIPPYCRIIRVIRDIPAPSIVAGTKISNLRELVAEELKKENSRCLCVRCREIKGHGQNAELKLFRQDYNASGGKEIFLSYEDAERKHLYSLLRLRIPSQIFENKNHFLKTLRKAAIIREAHTYGQEIPIDLKDKAAAQHKGLGKKMIEGAEKIAKKEFGLKKIAVIAGVGVRDYFSKLNYKLEGTYMVKFL